MTGDDVLNSERDFIADLSEAKSNDGVRDVFSDYLSGFGIAQFLYGALVTDSAGAVRDLVSVDTFDPEWMAFYVENNLVRIDFAAQHHLKSTLPLVFSRMYAAIDSAEEGSPLVAYRKTANLTRDWGVRNAVTIPIGSRGGLVSAITVHFDPNFSDAEYTRHFARQKQQILTAIDIFHTRIDMGEAAETHFGVTAREKEMLRWMADGLIGKQIAFKTGTSVHTVNKQITSAKKRLHAKTATQAVAKAVLLELI